MEKDTLVKEIELNDKQATSLKTFDLIQEICTNHLNDLHWYNFWQKKKYYFAGCLAETIKAGVIEKIIESYTEKNGEENDSNDCDKDIDKNKSEEFSENVYTNKSGKERLITRIDKDRVYYKTKFEDESNLEESSCTTETFKRWLKQ